MDRLVYALCGLAEKEIGIVEEATAKGEKRWRIVIVGVTLSRVAALAIGVARRYGLDPGPCRG